MFFYHNWFFLFFFHKNSNGVFTPYRNGVVTPWCFHTLSERCCDTKVFSHPIGSVFWLLTRPIEMKICFIPKIEVCNLYLYAQNIILKPSKVQNSNLYHQTTDPTGCENTMVSQHLSDRVWEHLYYFCEKHIKKN